MIVLDFKRFVPVPVGVAWLVIADHERYAEVADNLASVEVLQGDGLNMRRRCTDTKDRSWDETCVLWEPGRRYSFVVHTEAADYPYPLTALRGTWGVAPAVGGTVVSMRFEATPKWGWLGRILVGTAMRPAFEHTCRRLLDGWAERMLAQHRNAEPAVTPR